MKTNLKLKKAIKLRSEQDNLRIKALNKGVDLIAPETIFLSKDTKFGKNVKIEPYVVIGSKVKIGNNVTIKSFSHLEGAKLEKNVVVGPYARIRPGSHFLPLSSEGTREGGLCACHLRTWARACSLDRRRKFAAP